MLDELEHQVTAGEAILRQRLGNLRALLVISLLMTESVEEEQILQLASSSAPGLGHWRIEGYLFIDGAVGDVAWRPGTNGGSAKAPTGLTAQLTELGGTAGPVHLPGRVWASAFPLRS